MVATLLPYSTWIALIEFGGALLIVGYTIAACWVLLRNHSIMAARLLVADGALWGLNFKVAGSLLKTITLHTWEQLAFFAIIFALRTLLKWVFTWERARITLAQQGQEKQ